MTKASIAMTTEKQTLRLDQIRIDGGTQPRVAIDEQAVAEYAELYSEGVDLPPVTVFFDGATYWLADGFHRYWANKRINCDYVFAYVHSGTQRDAILYSVGANAEHGLRRTAQDKRRAVLTLLNDDHWSRKTQDEIAQDCKVSRWFVNKITKELSASCKRLQDGTRAVARNGQQYLQDTSKIGRTRKPRKAGGLSPDAMIAVRQPRPAPAQTNLNLPHDPIYGARAIVAAMGVEYAQQLIESLTTYLHQKKEGAA